MQQIQKFWQKWISNEFVWLSTISIILYYSNKKKFGKKFSDETPLKNLPNSGEEL
jgi:hypothetical protein